MKTLLGFRHSLKTPDSNISPAGLDRARRQGEACANYDISIAFVGPLPRTSQTRKEFLLGYVAKRKDAVIRTNTNPITPLGTDELFAEMVNPKFKQALAAGKSNFEALLAAHDDLRLDLWSDAIENALYEMFDQIADGETGAFFGHSPTTELAAASFESELNDLAPQYRILPEMAGIVFQMDDDDNMSVVDSIPVPAEPPIMKLDESRLDDTSRLG